ncbi:MULTISPECIES: alanine dehydrogenase [unclassified Methylococcus]|jgi:alanine dehydrogenase|uniref:alanine dehydrogenase n=1 Tax=unclassified Methylococcus TaxID=2618889 RepID=UPI003D7EB5EC
MKIGVPKEIKDLENRVAVTPQGVAALVNAGHEVLVEVAAGLGSGFADEEYLAAGARLVNAADAWAADLVVKVKEPVPSEYPYLKRQTVFTFFHLAGVDPGLTRALLDGGTTAVAYETLEDAQGRLPLLAPMSAVAGNMAAQVGAYYLARFNGGRGVQLGEVMGVRHGRVVVIGDGVVGSHAALTAWGMGANVQVMGLVPAKGDALCRRAPGLEFFLSDGARLAETLRDADLVVGAVLQPGARAEYIVTDAMVRSMPMGSVIVDVSIDQGGCVETSRPTTHSHPVYVEHGVIHYCVTNMPGAYPRTSTLALTEATLPYLLRLADEGEACLRADPGLAKAVNTYDGHITCRAAAEDLGLLDRYRPFPG